MTGHAGTSGQVLSTSAVPRCSVEVAVRLKAPERDSEANLVSAVVQASQGEAGVAETLQDGSIVAWLSEASSPEVSLKLVVSFSAF